MRACPAAGQSQLSGAQAARSRRLRTAAALRVETSQALCVLEAALAALQRHYVGIVAGLVTMGVAWYIVAATRIGQQARTVVFVCATFLAVALASYIIGLIGVRFAAGVLDSSLPFRTFPTRCPAGQGCARVAFQNPFGADGLQVLRVASDSTQVANDVLSRLNAEPQAYRVSLATDEPSYLQYVWLSIFWGFPDDIAVKLGCNSTLTTVQVHSQQRRKPLNCVPRAKPTGPKAGGIVLAEQRCTSVLTVLLAPCGLGLVPQLVPTTLARTVCMWSTSWPSSSRTKIAWCSFHAF